VNARATPITGSVPAAAALVNDGKGQAARRGARWLSGGRHDIDPAAASEAGLMYLILKTIHVLSVILFLGNIITGLFWKAHADATHDPKVQAHALAGVIRSDIFFTMPAVLVIIVSGVALASMAGLPLLGTVWIAASLAAFALSGLLFASFIAPLQRRLLNEALGAQPGAAWPSPDYRRLSRLWEGIGLIAIALPLAALALMIFKPAALF
jgi:uncharacterized membrane protein